ncbi:MAG: VOC family protein [Myxococcota bacterium]
MPARPAKPSFAKPCLDIALMTDRLDAARAFWGETVGLPFEETLRPQRGVAQHRFGIHGSVVKVNCVESLPEEPRSGIRALWIADPAVTEARRLEGPHGEHVERVAPGTRGITALGIGLAVRDRERHRAFYRDVLGFDEDGDALVCGTTRLFLEEDPDAPADASLFGPGYRYLTVQIFDCAESHRRALAAGAQEGAPPRRAGEVAIFSMVRDPDGNWVELSQRASLTGPLPAPG